MVRIALLSDIHFGRLARSVEFAAPGQEINDKTDGAASMHDSLVRILKEQQVSYICIPGDLTSEGKPHEFHYCQEKMISLAKDANISSGNIIWSIGNHDVDWSISRLASDYQSDPNYELIREQYRAIAASCASPVLNKFPKMEANCIPFSGIVDASNFVAFVLNSGHYCTHDQTISHGKLGEDQLLWLTNTLKEYLSDSRWKIVVLHHHPYDYMYPVPSFDTSKLEENSEFQSIIGKYGIDVVFHGHRHHPRAETVQINGWSKPITFICAGSFSVNANQRNNGEIPNTFHIVELSNTPGILSLYNYQYSLSDGWIPFKSNCSETPLDAVMKFGRICKEEDVVKAIKGFGTFPGIYRSITWNEADEVLHFLPLNNVNDRLDELLSDRFIIAGKFPNDVVLIKKEGNS